MVVSGACRELIGHFTQQGSWRLFTGIYFGSNLCPSTHNALFILSMPVPPCPQTSANRSLLVCSRGLSCLAQQLSPEFL